jgi:hypothetical protein
VRSRLEARVSLVAGTHVTAIARLAIGGTKRVGWSVLDGAEQVEETIYEYSYKVSEYPVIGRSRSWSVRCHGVPRQPWSNTLMPEG